MPPKRTPRKERTPGDYTALGRKGRRTGTELKDTGVRDENGLEPIPSFSSPVKSLFQPNGTTPDATYTADDSMDIDQSTIPEPTDLVRTARNGRISLPPRATSPIKTHLNSSPRRSIPRSMGPMSSPSRNLNNGTPSQAMSFPVERKLNFITDDPQDEIQQSIERSPQKAASSATASRLVSISGKGKSKKAFNLTTETVSEGENTSPLNDLEATNGIASDDGEANLPRDDDQFMQDSIMDHKIPEQDDAETLAHGLGADESEINISEPIAGAQEKRKRRGRPATKATIARIELQRVALPVSDELSHGRPKKPKTQARAGDDGGQIIDPSEIANDEQMPPPSQRNSNIVRKGFKKPVKKAPSSRAGSVRPGSRFVQRSETPANDDGALITRSGRQSIKPLAAYRGEKIVYGERHADSLPSIKEVVRVDEVVEPRPKRPAYKRGKLRARSKLEDVEEEEDEDRAPWETDPGIMVARIMDWDPTTNKYDEENTREEDVAYAFEAIEMRDISGADFKFAKTLTLDFFGAGMVDLPPGGAKRVKNSRKMQMVFFVFYGRVLVSIGTPPTKFTIGKGGQWQVPRGNFYSIVNESNFQSARIFFAQGCAVQEGITDESVMS